VRVSLRYYLGGKLEGECIKYYESGEISYKYSYLDGKRHGESIHYYKSGEIGSKSYYIDGKGVTHEVRVSLRYY